MSTPKQTFCSNQAKLNEQEQLDLLPDYGSDSDFRTFAQIKLLINPRTEVLAVI